MVSWVWQVNRCPMGLVADRTAGPAHVDAVRPGDERNVTGPVKQRYCCSPATDLIALGTD
jgi:hypothetical protein